MTKSPPDAPRLDALGMGPKLGRVRYARKLARLQHRLARIQQAYLVQGRSAVVVFEGWDAAGKGGTIRRISAAMDPRGFKVWPIGAPRAYYRERHFLARFMERLPPSGGISAFDRSWYGRVLVERVEELTPVERWRAAYREINDFERMVADDGVRIVKLFFHITPEEQLRRFEARLRNPMKRWKLSYEDFRNRRHWNDYAEAIDEMFARTSTAVAPWSLIAANDKRHARIEAISRIARVLSRGVSLAPPQIPEPVLAEAEAAFDLEPSLIRDLAGRTE